ncbi:hypothetical protein ABK040_010525 [Willaertia magna]
MSFNDNINNENVNNNSSVSIMSSKNNNNNSSSDDCTINNNASASFTNIPIIQWGNKEVVEWIESLDNNNYDESVIFIQNNNNNSSDYYNNQYCSCCNSLSSSLQYQSQCNLIHNFKDIAKYFKFHDIYGIDLISLEWKDIEIMFFENDYFQSTKTTITTTITTTLPSSFYSLEDKDNIDNTDNNNYVKDDKISLDQNDIYNNDDEESINNCCKEKCLFILQQFYFIIDSFIVKSNFVNCFVNKN